MVMTSALTLDPQGSLVDLPVGADGDITRLANGGYAMVAEMASTGFSILRIFDAAGAPVRSHVVAGTEPAITQMNNGSIAIATITADDTIDIFLVPEGSASVTIVNTVFTEPGLVSVSLAARGDGLALVYDASDQVSYVAMMGSGAFVDRVPVPNAPGLSNGDPHVATTSLGAAVVVYTQVDDVTGATSVAFSRFDANGGLVQANVAIPNISAPGEDSHARVVITGDGGFAIAYQTRVSGSLATDVRVRLFNAAGTETSNVIVSNLDLFQTGFDDGVDDLAPEIAVGPDGSIVVTWLRVEFGQLVQMVHVLGQNGTSAVGLGESDGAAGAPMVAFFGAGQIAAYRTDSAVGAMVGSHLSGFRDSFGDEGRDSFVGDDFTDLINGLGGRDTLDGAGGNDTVQGGDGDDLLFGGSGDDLLQGEEGVGANVPGRHRDRLFGGDGNDTLQGEDGNDRLEGGNHNDSLDGGIGADSLFGGTGDDSLEGGAGDDFMSGGQDNDQMFGGDGRDVMNGDDGDDALSGGLIGDLMDGGAGNDVLLGEEGNDTLIGSNGTDGLLGGEGQDRLFGGDGGDTLDGGAGRDTLFGGTGADFLSGGELADTLDGDGGTDVLLGGEGADRFVFSSNLGGNNVDQILDFVSGTDRIQLSTSVFLTLATTAGSGRTVTADMLRFGNAAVDGDDFLIYNQATGVLRYDSDRADGQNAITFARLVAGTVLSASDFEII